MNLKNKLFGYEEKPVRKTLYERFNTQTLNRTNSL